MAIAGGVSANSYLRSRLQTWGKESQYKVYIPKFEYCTDNAAMIAISGMYLFENGTTGNQQINVDPRLTW